MHFCNAKDFLPFLGVEAVFAKFNSPKYAGCMSLSNLQQSISTPQVFQTTIMQIPQPLNIAAPKLIATKRNSPIPSNMNSEKDIFTRFERLSGFVVPFRNESAEGYNVCKRQPCFCKSLHLLGRCLGKNHIPNPYFWRFDSHFPSRFEELNNFCSQSSVIAVWPVARIRFCIKAVDRDAKHIDIPFQHLLGREPH